MISGINSWAKKNKNLIFTSGLILLLLPFFYISLYVHPIADDFTYAVKGRTYDIFDNLIGEYLNWNGRYFSNLLVILSPLNYAGFAGYKLIPALILLLITASFYSFSTTFIKQIFTKEQTLIISLVMTLLYLHQMPDLAEGIYWYTGSVTYMTGNILLLPLIAMLYKLYNKDYIFKNSYVHISVIVLLLFIINGLNETHVISLWIILGVINLVLFLKKKKVNITMLALLLVTVIFSLVVILSPGNAVRESYFPNNHNLFESLYMSVAQTGRFLFEWISSIPLLIASFLFYRINITICERNKLFASSFFLKPWQSLALLLAVIFIGAFPAYWGTGILGQHRTMNVSYFLFLLAWFINLNVFFNKYPSTNYIPGKTTTTALLAFLIIMLVFTGNLFTVSYDIVSGRAERFDQQMYGRYNALVSGSGKVYFAPVSNPPESIFVMDISDNPEDWVNKGYTMYFDAEEKTILPGE